MYIIAEIGINHNGDFNLCKHLINKSVESGADAVKLQKRTVDLVYTQEELDKARESPWGTTNREQKQGLEFSVDQYKDLKQYCDERNIDFIVSCWDNQSIDDIECLDIKYHKVASALLTDESFIQKLNKTKKSIILSVGMSTDDEIDRAVSQLDNIEYILACTSTYPTDSDELNLLHINTLKSKYPNLKVGFSNHYSGHDACICATALGVECIEFHITHDRTAYGSDQAASIENSQELISGIRNAEKMLGNGIKIVYDSEASIAKKLRKV